MVEPWMMSGRGVSFLKPTDGKFWAPAGVARQVIAAKAISTRLMAKVSGTAWSAATTSRQENAGRDGTCARNASPRISPILTSRLPDCQRKSRCRTNVWRIFRQARRRFRERIGYNDHSDKRSHHCGFPELDDN